MRRLTATSSSPDYFFIGVLIILVIFGFMMLASASSDRARDRFGDGYYFIKKQMMNGLAIGFLGFLAGAMIYYHRLAKLSLPLLFFSIFLLILVLTPLLGKNLNGSSRWLSLGGFSFQPSEILKITFILYVATWLSRNKKRGISFLEGFLPFLIFTGVTGFLLVKQPSTTIAVIIFAAATIVYFVGGARFSFLGAMVLTGIMILAVVVSTTSYRMDRITTFLNPEKADTLNQGYHLNQALNAIGSGGWFGVGYGESTTKLNYLPEPMGDSIFAVTAEEFGFVGASALVTLFTLLIFRALIIAKQAPDTLGRLLVIGFASVIGLQTFINIGAISGILPLTGVPLPFVSYGGTSLAVFLTMAGVIVNVSRYRK